MAGTMTRLDEIYDAGSARLRAHSAYGVILTVRRKDTGGLLALKTVQTRQYGDTGVVLGSERRDDNVGMLQDEIDSWSDLGRFWGASGVPSGGEEHPCPCWTAVCGPATRLTISGEGALRPSSCPLREK